MLWKLTCLANGCWGPLFEDSLSIADLIYISCETCVPYNRPHAKFSLINMTSIFVGKCLLIIYYALKYTWKKKYMYEKFAPTNGNDFILSFKYIFSLIKLIQCVCVIGSKGRNFSWFFITKIDYFILIIYFDYKSLFLHFKIT